MSLRTDIPSDIIWFDVLVCGAREDLGVRGYTARQKDTIRASYYQLRLT